MSLGTGYEYLLRSVARGDGAVDASTALTRYYEESGTPPGRFLGAGLAGLADGVGVPAGSEVSEEQLFWLLGMLADPVTHQPLGRAPHKPTATPDGRPARLPVAGFDLTFSVPKSVSAVWAVADAATQEAIHRAHRDAIDIALAWAEQNVVFTRTGIAGTRQEPVRGVVAAAFDHWDSRGSDPHLHTHVVVANRVQTLDGRWRTLDSKTLFGYVVALSELHEGVTQDLLTERLGYRWTERPRRHSTVPRHDIDGVPNELIEAFSSRSHDIEDAKNRLVQAFVDTNGRHPDDVEVLRLRQQATLSTRPDKQHRSLAEMTSIWRARAASYIGHNTSVWVGSLRVRNDLPALSAEMFEHDMLAAAGAAALEAVGRKRATFKHANVLAEVHRQLHGAHFATPTDRLALASRITEHALRDALLLTEPTAMTSSRIWTTRQILDAETRLLEASRTIVAPGIPTSEIAFLGVDPDSANGEGAGPETPSLGADQAAAVTAIASSGRVLDLFVGPAGSGKTASLAALRRVWEQHWGAGSVIGLAPSASAADVLGTELGITADNTAKWLIETRRTAARDMHIADLEHQLATTTSSLSTARGRHLSARLAEARTERKRWTPRLGQLIVIDEAGLAGTLALDEIVRSARATGAKVLLVGDWAQLGAVDAGGAFRMLVNDRGSDTPELTSVRRFLDDWERDASLQLRNGDPACLDAYRDHDRIRAGTREQMLDALYLAWKHDTDNGLDSLMIAPDHDTAIELNRRAQLSGPTDRPVVPLGDGTTARVGDRIITRRNDRTLTTGPRRWVKNGDTWTITDTTNDGAIIAASRSGQHVALPAAYVQDHVELGYAITTHQAQGRTVTTAHAYVDERTSHGSLYVAITRGRAANLIYVETTNANDLDVTRDPRDLLHEAIHRQPDNHAALTLLRKSATSVPEIASLDRAPDWDEAPITRSTVETLQAPVSPQDTRHL